MPPCSKKCPKVRQQLAAEKIRGRKDPVTGKLIPVDTQKPGEAPYEDAYAQAFTHRDPNVLEKGPYKDPATGETLLLDESGKLLPEKAKKGVDKPEKSGVTSDEDDIYEDAREWTTGERPVPPKKQIHPESDPQEASRKLITAQAVKGLPGARPEAEEYIGRSPAVDYEADYSEKDSLRDFGKPQSPRSQKRGTGKSDEEWRSPGGTLIVPVPSDVESRSPKRHVGDETLADSLEKREKSLKDPSISSDRVSRGADSKQKTSQRGIEGDDRRHPDDREPVDGLEEDDGVETLQDVKSLEKREKSLKDPSTSSDRVSRGAGSKKKTSQRGIEGDDRRHPDDREPVDGLEEDDGFETSQDVKSLDKREKSEKDPSKSSDQTSRGGRPGKKPTEGRVEGDDRESYGEKSGPSKRHADDRQLDDDRDDSGDGETFEDSQNTGSPKKRVKIVKDSSTSSGRGPPGGGPGKRPTKRGREEADRDESGPSRRHAGDPEPDDDGLPEDWDYDAHNPCDPDCPIEILNERYRQKLEERQKMIDRYLLSKGLRYFEDMCTCSLICVLHHLWRDPFVRSTLAAISLFSLGLKLTKEMEAWYLPTHFT